MRRCVSLTLTPVRAKVAEELAEGGGQSGDGEGKASLDASPPDAPEVESGGGQEPADGGPFLPGGALLVSEREKKKSGATYLCILCCVLRGSNSVLLLVYISPAVVRYIYFEYIYFFSFIPFIMFALLFLSPS